MRRAFSRIHPPDEIFVPGGTNRFTAGDPESATASLSINKTDFFGTFLALGWTY